MNFKFKLSRRLAGIKGAAIIGLALLGACSTNDAPTGPTTAPSLTDTTTVTAHPAATPSGYFVSPSGSASGDGSADHPWDLQTALNGGNGTLTGGDTVWMHGGTYAGFFVSSASGAPGKVLVFRQYPGERATIDGYMRANGSDVAFWGFEIMRSTPNDRLPGVEARGPRQKYINLVVHDAAQQGITFWDEAVDAVVYGCIVYNNGTHQNLDHGTYVHNMRGTKLIKDNVFFDNLAYGIHVYSGPTDGLQVNVHVVGNVAFDNGTISGQYPAKTNILVGGEAGDAGMQVTDNLTYMSGDAGNNLWLGYNAANQDIVARNNFAWGGATGMIVGSWSSATIEGNTFGGNAAMIDLRGPVSGLTWSGNHYYRDASAAAWMPSSGDLNASSSPEAFAPWQSATGLSGDVADGSPATTKVFVRPNDYEGGRALIVVYNFGHQGSVSADISRIGLGRGQRYEVRNVQDYYGAPVASGTYDGGPVTLPMTGVTPPALIGRTLASAPKTGPDFDTFVVIPM